MKKEVGFKGFNYSISTIILAIFCLLIFLFPLISSSFNSGNPKSSLDLFYGPSQNITGWVNISFNSEPLNSTFSDSRGNTANLSNVLKKNALYKYTCSPLDCGDDYATSNGNPVKSFTLNSGQSSILGIRLTGNIFSIDSLKLTLESNAPASCTNQVAVDFLDDSSIDSINKNSLESQSCLNLRDYGCFNAGQVLEERVIGITPYCEKVVLSSSPGFFIGGWVKKNSGNAVIRASLYGINGGASLATCDLPDASSLGEEVFCSVNYSLVKPAEHYVCIYSPSGSGVYSTRGYDIANGCGFYGTPIPSQTPAAYQISAQGKQFDAVGTLDINSSITDGKTFAELAEDYIIKKYGTLDCTAGCVLPIKISSNSTQDITLKNLEVRYQKQSGVVIESNFYDIAKTSAKATSNLQKLYLDGSGFTVPSNIGNYTFNLVFNNQSVLSQKVEVKDVPIITSINPVKTAAAYPTEFGAIAVSAYNITGFSWDFGDNTPVVSSLTNKTTHTYNQTGVYNVKVTATDQRNLKGSRSFEVNVTSPKDLINSTLTKMEKNIATLQTEISSLTGFTQDALNFSLSLDFLALRVRILKSEYQNATSESQYSSIVQGILALKIPEGISNSKSADGITFFSGAENVDMNVLQEIGGSGNYSSSMEDDYINSVLVWQQENLDTKINFDEFSGRYTGFVEPITKIFEITVDEKRDISYDYYLILPELQGFHTSSAFSRKSGYVYINMRGKNSVSFSTTDNVDFTNLPAFISPAISRLSTTTTLPEEKSRKWALFSLVLFFLLVVGFIVYVVLHQWYKRKYENHLFPNRNDLYNMVIYVNHAKKKGMKSHEIESSLKKAGWSAERIRYVMRKYVGKNTGMFELPITKIAERAGGKHGK